MSTRKVRKSDLKREDQATLDEFVRSGVEPRKLQALGDALNALLARTAREDANARSEASKTSATRPESDDPFAHFDEWATEADDKAYADL
jgi:hypothetical protein